MARRPTINHVAIFGFLVLSVVALSVVVLSVLSVINPLNEWGYVGLITIAFLSLVLIYISPNSIEANIPGFGPVSVDGTESSPSVAERSQEGEKPSPTNFAEYVELTGSLSAELSNQLHQIQASDFADPFEATSAIISEGMKVEETNPVKETIEILESDLAAREFILNSENHDMDVVQVGNDRVIARLDDGQHPPNPDLEFKLRANTAIDVGGTTETFGEWVGTVRVEEVDEPLCIMEVISWGEDISDDPPERQAELMRRGAWVEIGLEEAENIDWDSMEEAYEKLKTLQDQGEWDYAN